MGKENSKSTRLAVSPGLKNSETVIFPSTDGAPTVGYAKRQAGFLQWVTAQVQHKLGAAVAADAEPGHKELRLEVTADQSEPDWFDTIPTAPMLDAPTIKMPIVVPAAKSMPNVPDQPPVKTWVAEVAEAPSPGGGLEGQPCIDLLNAAPPQGDPVDLSDLEGYRLPGFSVSQGFGGTSADESPVSLKAAVGIGNQPHPVPRVGQQLVDGPVDQDKVVVDIGDAAISEAVTEKPIHDKDGGATVVQENAESILGAGCMFSGRHYDPRAVADTLELVVSQANAAIEPPCKVVSDVEQQLLSEWPESLPHARRQQILGRGTLEQTRDENAGERADCPADMSYGAGDQGNQNRVIDVTDTRREEKLDDTNTHVVNRSAAFVRATVDNQQRRGMGGGRSSATGIRQGERLVFPRREPLASPASRRKKNPSGVFRRPGVEADVLASSLGNSRWQGGTYCGHPDNPQLAAVGPSLTASALTVTHEVDGHTGADATHAELARAVTSAPLRQLDSSTVAPAIAPPQELLERIRDRASFLEKFPDLGSPTLRLALYYRVKPSQVLLTDTLQNSRRATERMLELLEAVSVDLVLPCPKIWEDQMKRRGCLVRHLSESQLTSRSDQLSQHTSDEASKVVVMSNPNRYTGHHYSVDELADLAQRYRWLIVDETLRPFSPLHDEGLVDLPNAVLIRNIARPWYTPGLEGTCLVGPAELIQQIARTQDGIKPSPLMIAASEVYTSEGALERQYDYTKLLRAQSDDLCAKLGSIAGQWPELHVHDGDGMPFVRARVDQSPKVWRALVDKGWLVRTCDDAVGLGGEWARICAHQEGTNSAFVDALESALRETSGSAA